MYESFRRWLVLADSPHSADAASYAGTLDEENLYQVAFGVSYQLPSNYDAHRNRLIRILVGVPSLSEDALDVLGSFCDENGPDFETTLEAVCTHPNSTEDVALDAMFAYAHSDITPAPLLERLDFLAPAAYRLAFGPSDSLHSPDGYGKYLYNGVVYLNGGRLAGALLTDLSLQLSGAPRVVRSAVRGLSSAWTGTLDELVATSYAIVA